MKRLICMILMLCLLIPWAGAESVLNMINPWTDTTEKDIMEKLGLSFNLPDSAEEVVYRMLESESLAEAQFVMDGSDCVARIRPSMTIEDISGMYYDWALAEDCEIQWCPGRVMQTEEEGKAVSLCLWYDVVPGLMYSVGVIGETNALSLANMLFMPAQGDADAQPADLFRFALEKCIGYEGTAGASLKEAIAAAELLAFAVEYADEENLPEMVRNGMASFSGEEVKQIEASLKGIRFVIESAFVDYESISGLFDDAGVEEWMRELIRNPDAQANWNALNSCL